MRDDPPKLIAIDHDDHHASHIGWTADGRQFFLTTPFEPPNAGREGGEFVALFLFDDKGKLLEARIEDFGPRAKMDEQKRSEQSEVHERWFGELGEVTHSRIVVAPFAIERFGMIFGLVLREPETEDDPWAVELLPGNYMAFFAPWDSGTYDT